VLRAKLLISFFLSELFCVDVSPPLFFFAIRVGLFPSRVSQFCLMPFFCKSYDFYPSPRSRLSRSSQFLFGGSSGTYFPQTPPSRMVSIAPGSHSFCFESLRAKFPPVVIFLLADFPLHPGRHSRVRFFHLAPDGAADKRSSSFGSAPLLDLAYRFRGIAEQ